MTVRELIAELQNFDPEASVWTEGCDCDGEAGSVEDDGESVTIKRKGY